MDVLDDESAGEVYVEKSELLEDILEDVEDIQYRVDMVKMALEDILNMDSDDDDEGNRLKA